MFLIIVLKESFRNVMHGHLFFNFMVKNTNLKHKLRILLRIFFLR